MIGAPSGPRRACPGLAPSALREPARSTTPFNSPVIQSRSTWTRPPKNLRERALLTSNTSNRPRAATSGAVSSLITTSGPAVEGVRLGILVRRRPALILYDGQLHSETT